MPQVDKDKEDKDKDKEVKPKEVKSNPQDRINDTKWKAQIKRGIFPPATKEEEARRLKEAHGY